MSGEQVHILQYQVDSEQEEFKFYVRWKRGKEHVPLSILEQIILAPRQRTTVEINQSTYIKENFNNRCGRREDLRALVAIAILVTTLVTQRY